MEKKVTFDPNIQVTYVKKWIKKDRPKKNQNPKDQAIIQTYYIQDQVYRVPIIQNYYVPN